MDGRSRAYIEVLLLRAAWRAAQDAEAQVAHWLLDGQGGVTREDLVAARERTRLSKRALTHAHRVYVRQGRARDRDRDGAEMGPRQARS